MNSRQALIHSRRSRSSSLQRLWNPWRILRARVFDLPAHGRLASRTGSNISDLHRRSTMGLQLNFWGFRRSRQCSEALVSTFTGRLILPAPKLSASLTWSLVQDRAIVGDCRCSPLTPRTYPSLCPTTTLSVECPCTPLPNGTRPGSQPTGHLFHDFHRIRGVVSRDCLSHML